MKWDFEKYTEDSTRQDSSSEEFFKEASESDSLIREFIQNSLDASNNSKAVKVIINEKHLNKEDLTDFLTGLEPHLKSCSIQDYKKQQKIKFIILEDFNTKGLEGENKEKFFKADNITNKKEGGGSYGIGKAVFLAISKIKTFFGYSIFSNNQPIFQGRAVLKTHKIDNSEYRPYGDLKKIPHKDKMDFIDAIFKRKAEEKGLSIAIPYCEDIKIEDLKRSCLEQFYLPIIKDKLEIEIGNDKINKEVLLDSQDPKIKLAMEYITSSKSTKYSIKEREWKNQKFPQIDTKLIEQNSTFFLSFDIELRTKQGMPETGKAYLLIKKEEENIESSQSIDFWRDNLLITKAISRGKKQKGYSSIFIICDNPLSRLLRELEDPGHTRWRTGSIKPEIKEKYTNIRKLVDFVKKIPVEFIRQIKYQSIEQDSHFFSDYFPDDSSIGKKQITEGGLDSRKGIKPSSIPEEPQFPNFVYKPHKKGDGFTLSLKKQGHYPDKLTVITAYGTNKGNAFSNYDKRDFDFNQNITIKLKNENSGERISCEKNSISYLIKDESFGISFTGFDPDKELKIDIK